MRWPTWATSPFTSILPSAIHSSMVAARTDAGLRQHLLQLGRVGVGAPARAWSRRHRARRPSPSQPTRGAAWAARTSGPFGLGVQVARQHVGKPRTGGLDQFRRHAPGLGRLGCRHRSACVRSPGAPRAPCGCAGGCGCDHRARRLRPRPRHRPRPRRHRRHPLALPPRPSASSASREQRRRHRCGHRCVGLGSHHR